MEKMKYYLSELTHQNGEFEYETKFIFQTDGDAQAFVDQQARTFYGYGVEEDDDGILWVSDTTIDSGHPYEIKKDTFDDLKSTNMWEAKDE